MSSDDTLDARAYVHLALGERKVVRLVSSTLAAAEDLALEFLGLRLVGVDGAVTRGRRQALGFPAWALVNDPANGAYALAIVKDMERLARLARSKPGAARDGFEQLGQQLARTVPHFLPTFYEQVGRTYIASDQANHAATMFSRAREAERVYGLAIDEDRRREVFVEFALAGALSSKAIDELADQLAANMPALEAYQTLRELCVQRTLGGVPPSASMGERLTRMARLAGLDVDAEAAQLVLQLIDAPGTSRAAAGFWKAYRTSLIALARGSPVLRGKLLNLFPAPQPGAPRFVDWWLDLLSRTGATDALTQPAGSVPPEAEPAGGPAGWLSRLVARQNQGWSSELPGTLPSLVEGMAARLQADGVAVDLIGQHAWRADVDLIDLALALRVPLAPPGDHAMLSVAGYGARQPQRDLLQIVQDPVFGPRVAEALELNLARGYSHVDRLPRRAGVQRLVREWLDRRADQFEHGGLPQIEYALARLETSTTEATLALNPAARARIAAADLANAVARTLRGGIVDEFGWPALEAAHAKVQAGPNGKLRVDESWPNLVVADAQRAIVVGPDGILLEHDLRLPSNVSGAEFFCADGQLMVCWYDTSTRASRAYWSAQPGRIFDSRRKFGAPSEAMVSVELPNGGRTRGGRAFHAGDTSLLEATQVLADGATFWRLVEGGELREYDPVSGRAGRASLPPFFRTLVRDGASLQLAACWLLPVLPGLEASPLGVADGLLGWVVRGDGTAGASAWRGRRIDGAEFAGRLAAVGSRRGPNGTIPLGLLDFPGDASAPRPFSFDGQHLSVWSPDGARELFKSPIGVRSEMALGSPIVLPPLFWHCLRPRDPAGSRALRDCLTRPRASSSSRQPRRSRPVWRICAAPCNWWSACCQRSATHACAMASSASVVSRLGWRVGWRRWSIYWFAPPRAR